MLRFEVFKFWPEAISHTLFCASVACNSQTSPSRPGLNGLAALLSPHVFWQTERSLSAAKPYQCTAVFPAVLAVPSHYSSRPSSLE
eukprot:scaffold76727_cov49-Phaeocystis_antarctica.AAC.1